MTIYGRRFHGCRADEYTWRGHRLIVLENEHLKIAVLASKGADVIELRYKPRDLDLLWHAPQSVLPAGRFVPTSAREQGAFLDYYEGGWQEVFPSAGPATSYRGAELGQHGEVSLQPWDVRVIDDRPTRVSVEFSVETVRTPFRLERVMTLETGRQTLFTEGRAMNLGNELLHFQWGQHLTLGAPFLAPGCTLQMPDCEVLQPVYAKHLRRRLAIECPGRYPKLPLASGAPGRIDQVLSEQTGTEDVLQMSGFDTGNCLFRNTELDLALTLEWPSEVFPYFWCWQAFGGSYGYPYYGRAYALGLEPFSGPIETLAESVLANRALPLAPGADVQSWFRLSLAPCN